MGTFWLPVAEQYTPVAHSPARRRKVPPPSRSLSPLSLGDRPQKIVCGRVQVYVTGKFSNQNANLAITQITPEAVTDLRRLGGDV